MKNGSMETDGSNRSITHSIHFFLLSDLSCKFVILNSIFLQFFNNGDLIRRCCSSDCGMFLSSFVDLIGWICFNFTCCSRHRFHESQQIGLIHRNSMILNGRINQLPSYSYRLWFTGGKRARSKKEKKAFSDRSMPSVYKTSGGGTCNAVLFKSSGDPEIQSSSHRHDSLIKWFTNKKDHDPLLDVTEIFDLKVNMWPYGSILRYLSSFLASSGIKLTHDSLYNRLLWRLFNLIKLYWIIMLIWLCKVNMLASDLPC